MEHYKMFKILTGEFIICGTGEETETTIEVDTPFVAHFQTAPNGQLGISLFPFNPFATKSDEKYIIKKEHIFFFIDEIKPELIAQYVEIVSGIVVATPPMEIITP
jgi:hypothetical protein